MARQLRICSMFMNAPPLARVLVADDDPDMRMLIRTALAKDGYDVIEATNGSELLEQLQSALSAPASMPDVIVLDVVMPCHSGLQVLRALRRANWMTPVIMMSAVVDDLAQQIAKDLGVAGFFRKPFDLDDLRTAVIRASASSSRSRILKSRVVA